LRSKRFSSRRQKRRTEPTQIALEVHACQVELYFNSNISKSTFSGLNKSDYVGAVLGKTLSLLGCRVVEECPKPRISGLPASDRKSRLGVWKRYRR
jgi:hypothetical protein